MIITDLEYNVALKKSKLEAVQVEEQRQKLVGMGLSADQVQNAMEPLEAFHLGLLDRIQHYENLKAGKIPPLYGLKSLGRWLVEIRIATGLTQEDLARELNLLPQKIIRDEYNEYHGITLERAAVISEAIIGFNYKLRIDLEKKS
jgi:hypothetical protein